MHDGKSRGLCGLQIPSDHGGFIKKIFSGLQQHAGRIGIFGGCTQEEIPDLLAYLESMGDSKHPDFDK